MDGGVGTPEQAVYRVVGDARFDPAFADGVDDRLGGETRCVDVGVRTTDLEGEVGVAAGDDRDAPLGCAGLDRLPSVRSLPVEFDGVERGVGVEDGAVPERVGGDGDAVALVGEGDGLLWGECSPRRPAGWVGTDDDDVAPGGRDLDPREEGDAADLGRVGFVEVVVGHGDGVEPPASCHRRQDSQAGRVERGRTAPHEVEEPGVGVEVDGEHVVT